MTHIKYLLIILLPLLLAACSEHGEGERASDNKAASSKEEVYDYRDERYQDFYSRYMRKTGKDYLSFDPKDIQEKLGLESVPEDSYGRIDIFRRESSDQKTPLRNFYKTSSDVVSTLNKNGEKYTICEKKYQIDNLFCLQEIKFPEHSQNYYYLPNESTKISYINQPIVFYCMKLNGERKCKVSNYLNDPYNLNISIHFMNPKNFFYIMPFVEKHFYETTGEHIWQSLPKR